jgi:prolipoprotein diacylglyceryltransferase
MSFIGGILGVVVCMGSYLWSQKASRKDILILFDLILAFVPLGIFL